MGCSCNNVAMAGRFVFLGFLYGHVWLSVASDETARRGGLLHRHERSSRPSAWEDPVEASIEAEHQNQKIVKKSVEMSESFSPDVTAEFEPELPGEAGGVWDFDAAVKTKDGTFATPSGPDPLVMPLGLLATGPRASAVMLDD